MSLGSSSKKPSAISILLISPSIHPRCSALRLSFKCFSSCSLRVRRFSRVVMAESLARGLCLGRGRLEGILKRRLIAQYAGQTWGRPICVTSSNARQAWIDCNETRVLSLMFAAEVNSGTGSKKIAHMRSLTDSRQSYSASRRHRFPECRTRLTGLARPACASVDHEVRSAIGSRAARPHRRSQNETKTVAPILSVAGEQPHALASR